MHTASPARYDAMPYLRVGRSGLKLPYVSLGLWHNFGSAAVYDSARTMLLGAFDLGVTHFDCANNYGPEPGTAEETLGRVLRDDLKGYRDELIVSTKAGYLMWPGPYGEWGSRKNLLASLDQSLKRLRLDYVDIFYSHRPDPETPLEETMGALAQAVRQGKALYVGLSNYNPEQTERAVAILDQLGVPCLIHQMRYNMLNREAEKGLYQALEKRGIGAICFSPLAQGLLSDRYLNGIPADSRAASQSRFLRPEQIDKGTLAKIAALNRVAKARGQSLAQMALSWLHRSPVTASVLVGASKLSQIEDSVQAASAAPFSEEELKAIDAACGL